jgi:acyl carrier protein
VPWKKQQHRLAQLDMRLASCRHNFLPKLSTGTNKVKIVVRKDSFVVCEGETLMEKEEITDKLKSVFQKVLEENDITITREMTAQDIEKWDSLRHIQLINEVERAYGITFKLREVLSMKNVGDLIDLIHAKQRVPA